MTPLPKSILIDTNVWLDNYIGSRSTKKTSRSLIDLCRYLEIDLYLAAVSLKDVYYNIGAALKRERRAEGNPIDSPIAISIEEYAWKCVLNMMKIGTLVPVDTSDFVTARYYHQVHPDLEDDLILAAAQRARANYLVTTDEKLLRHAPVAAITPGDMHTLLESLE